MVRAISFIGHHDSGKTRLMTRLVPVLVERGYRIGSIKHAPHLEDVDVSGSDSSMHRAAGIERVLLVAEMSSALFWTNDATEPLDATVERHFGDLDVVLIEGFKTGPFPKIEIYRRLPNLAREPLAGEVDVAAVVTDDPIALPDGVALLSPSRLLDIADFVETLIA